MNGLRQQWRITGDFFACNASGNVIAILLYPQPSHPQTVTIPSSLGDLSSLEVLRIRADRNNLSGSIPSSLGNLLSLRILEISAGGLSGSIPSSFGNLSNLEYLDLRGLQLSGTIPSSFGTLSSLKFLALHGNRLSGSIPANLGNLSNLEWLTLNDNQLSGTVPSSLSHLANLQRLEIGNNKLSGVIPSSLSNLSSLKVLVLSGNQLNGTIPSSLGNLSNLEILYLYNNRLSGPIPTSLGSLSNLIRLEIGNNPFSGSIPSSLGNLSNLWLLDLRGTPLSGVIPPSICSHPRFNNFYFPADLSCTENGQCGSVLNSCVKGIFSDLEDSSTQYKWQCLGKGGGITATCSKNKSNPIPTPTATPAINGQCGTAIGTCAVGLPSAVSQGTSGTGPINVWTCSGLSGGMSASCSAPGVPANLGFTLAASPNPVQIPAPKLHGTANITYTVNNYQSDKRVIITVGNSETYVAGDSLMSCNSAASGTKVVDWIPLGTASSGGKYFHLHYVSGNCSQTTYNSLSNTTKKISLHVYGVRP